MTLHITSPGESQESINSTLGITPEPESPAAPQLEAEGEIHEESATPEHEEEIDHDESEEDESEEESSEREKKGKKPGFKRRIDKLTRRAAKAEAEVEFWRQKALEEGKKPPQEQAQSPSNQEGKPSPEYFESHEQYIEALTDWKLDQREKARAAKEQEEQAKKDLESKSTAWNERLKDARKQYKDFDEVLDSDVPLTPVMREVLITSEAGAHLAYWLGTHPEEARQISALHPLAQAKELGRIEDRISSSQKPKNEPKTTTAPKPLSPVGSKAAPAQKHPDDMTQAEFTRWRAQGGGK